MPSLAYHVPVTDHPVSRSLPALAVALAALLVSRVTWPQQLPTTPAVEIIFSCHECGLDEAEVRAAVRAEAGVSEGLSSRGAAVLQLDLDREHLRARYAAEHRPAIERSMELPRDRARAIQAIALLSANLVRDQASELLDALRPRPDAPPADAPPTSATASATAPPPPPAPPAPSSSAATTAPILPPAPAAGRTESRPTRALNLSLWNPIALYPTSAEQSFHVELGLLYGRVGELRGGALGLGATVVQERLDGVALASVGTIAGQTRGFMLGLGGNWTRGSMSGMQAAGLGNASGGESAGVQLAGANLAFGGFDGLQVGLINYASGSYRGAQVGLINVGGRVSGTQVGVLNVADEVDGFPVGPVNLNRTGRMQVQLWSTTGWPGNVGLRYLHGHVYTLLGAGWKPAATDRVAWQLALGGHIPISSFFLDGDAGYAHEGEAVQGRGIEHTQVFRYRVMAGWQPVRAFGLFAGCGVRHEFPGAGGARARPEALAGLQVF